VPTALTAGNKTSKLASSYDEFVKSRIHHVLGFKFQVLGCYLFLLLRLLKTIEENRILTFYETVNH